jgi:tetratricopeptide (TPR) repeat protein
MDAPYLRDDDLVEKTHNAIYDAKGYPQGFYQSAVSRHALRLATDPNVGRFLYRLIQLQASRVLTSSRLFPADLQRPDGYPIPGCDAMFLQGLSESDALELWREYGAKGSSDVMLPIFRSFGCHPLVLKVFAGKVANYRLAPGDFDAWHQANPDFKPYGELVQVQSHIFKHALRDLCDSERQTLNLVAAFRMPAGIETLQSLLVDRDAVPVSEYDVEKRLEAPFRTLGELDSALTHLEDRGLLGWDRMANRYDLHPIVRGVVWDLLQVDHRHAVWEKLRSHLNTIRPTASEKIESLDDLAYAIEHFDKLVSLARYEEAFGVFRHHLDDATSHRLSAAQVRLSLLERLFPNGIDNPPRLEKIRAQSWVLDTLASAFNVAGRPAKAAELFARAVEMDRHPKDWENLAVGLCNCSERVP